MTDRFCSQRAKNGGSMKKVIVALLVISAAGCGWWKKQSCEIQKTLALGTATGMAAALACSNPKAIEEDLNDVLTSLKMCSKDSLAAQQKGFGVCTMVSDGLVELVFAKGIPADWECTGGVTKEAAKSAAQMACEKLPL